MPLENILFMKTQIWSLDKRDPINVSQSLMLMDSNSVNVRSSVVNPSQRDKLVPNLLAKSLVVP